MEGWLQELEIGAPGWSFMSVLEGSLMRFLLVWTLNVNALIMVYHDGHSIATLTCTLIPLYTGNPKVPQAEQSCVIVPIYQIYGFK